MLRALVVVLIAVTAVLGYVFEQPLLYGAALVVALAGAVSIVASRPRSTRARPAPVASEDLESLGIVEIRPRAAQAPAAATSSDTPAAPAVEPDEVVPSGDAIDAPVPPEAVVSGATLPPLPDHDESAPMDAASDSTHDPVSSVSAARPRASRRLDPAVLHPLLEALRASTQAHTVCLLRQDDIALSYYIEGSASQSPYVRAHGTFSTTTALLKASMTVRPTTQVEVGDAGIPAQSLRYYHEPVGVAQLLLAPVRTTSSDDGLYFLLLDTLVPGTFEQAQTHLVVEHVASLLSVLLTGTEEAPAETAQAMRPRREIVAEEMTEARAHEHSLALALVHAPMTDEQAEDATVASVEKRLASRLRDAVPGGRVERFGELTYGLFLSGPITDVEERLHNLQTSLQAYEEIDGAPMSVGVALLQDRHETAKAFRADATAALREAYESGRWILIES